MTNVRCKPKGEPPACACGCGAPTAWQGSDNRYARFVMGHQNVGRVSPLRKERPAPPLCGCGCGKPVATYRYSKGWATYLLGHAPHRAHTEASKAKMRKSAQARAASITGPANPCWRGGIAADTHRNHPSARKPSGYLATVDRVRLRDGNQCVLCGATTHLDCHHIDGDLENNAGANLATLCHRDHMRAEFAGDAESYRERIREYISTL